MVRRKVFVAFDFDDLDVKENFIAQSKLPDAPFELIDGSISAAVPVGWPEEARRRIGGCECVIVLCGVQTHQSAGVAVEVQIAQELKKRYFLLQATRLGTPTKPKHARTDDRIWPFRWPTVVALLEGRVPPDSVGP